MPAPLPAPTLRSALDRARAAWLAGDAGAWDRYRACLRQIETEPKEPMRPRTDRRTHRPRARA